MSVIFPVGTIHDGEFHHECISQDGRATADSKGHEEPVYRGASGILLRTFPNRRDGTRCYAQVEWQSDTQLKSCEYIAHSEREEERCFSILFVGEICHFNVVSFDFAHSQYGSA